MSKNKKEKSKHDKKYFFDNCNAASFRECTGLIQVPPEDEYEYESYEEIYGFSPNLIEEDEK